MRKFLESIVNLLEKRVLRKFSIFKKTLKKPYFILYFEGNDYASR